MPPARARRRVALGNLAQSPLREAMRGDLRTQVAFPFDRRAGVGEQERDEIGDRVRRRGPDAPAG